MTEAVGKKSRLSENEIFPMGSIDIARMISKKANADS